MVNNVTLIYKKIRYYNVLSYKQYFILSNSRLIGSSYMINDENLF